MSGILPLYFHGEFIDICVIVEFSAMPFDATQDMPGTLTRDAQSVTPNVLFKNSISPNDKLYPCKNMHPHIIK